VKKFMTLLCAKDAKLSAKRRQDGVRSRLRSSGLPATAIQNQSFTMGSSMERPHP
jgi:hypothetical protein